MLSCDRTLLIPLPSTFPADLFPNPTASPPGSPLSFPEKRVLAAAYVNVRAAVLVSGLGSTDKHGECLPYYWIQFAQQLLPWALIFMNGFIVGGRSLQQPGETVTGVYGAVHHVSVFRYCGVSGARCWANPSLAAGNLALARNADNYTKCGKAELVMFTWRK